MTGLRFEDYIAICATKARYCRCLDGKDWDGYGDTFTENVIVDTRPSGGDLMQTRAGVVAAVRGKLGTATTVHQVHSPEIAMIDGDTADVVWAMQDRIIRKQEQGIVSGKRSLVGYGHYHERYVRHDDGPWRIARCTLTRLHIDYQDDGPGAAK